ncbi:MAG: glycoside hydrolase family protein [Clostridia bacterium]|nr:glycoside hydrolase family protein [Clostridia bacterium]
MKQNFKKILATIFAVSFFLGMFPFSNLNLSVFAANYSDSQLANIKNSVLSNKIASAYVDNVMRYYLKNNTRVKQSNLDVGKAVVFLFDGCSDNVFSGSFDYSSNHRSAYCAVVKIVNSIPTIVYENENSSTIPDNPRMVNSSIAGNYGTDVPTVIDGIHNITKINHNSSYAALHVQDSGSGVSVIRCNNSQYYSSTSYGINIHARGWNNVSTSTYSSTGCFNIGIANDWSEYNNFMYAVTGKSNAKSSKFSSSETGADVGVVIVDRLMCADNLAKIYKNDSAVISSITSFSTSLIKEFASKISGSGLIGQNLADFVLNFLVHNKSESRGYESRTTSSKGIDLVKRFEGSVIDNNGMHVAYVDVGGTLTIGYGHTGKEVYSGMKINESQATQYLSSDLSSAEKAVNAFAKKYNRYLTQEQFDALVSFTFNVGSGWTYDSSYNIHKYMSTGDHTSQQVKDTFGSWVKADGKVSQGLVSRRAKESALYLYGTYDGTGGSSDTSNSGTITDNSYSSESSYSPGYYKVKPDIGVNVRSGPGTNYSKNTAYKKGTIVTITSTSGNWGKCSAGWICIDYMTWQGALEPEIKKPAAPSLSLTSAVNTAVGEAVTITWNAAADATSYDIYLRNSAGNIVDQSIGNTGRSAAFTLGSAEKFTVTAVSKNSKYTSDISNTITVTAHNPSTVRFLDWDGTEVSNQTVPYGKSATVPSNPSRHGWTFKTWNGKYTNVTTDQIVNAYYERNIYTVTFLDEVGTLIGEKQKVQFESAATAPNYTAPEGYDFLGWDQEFDYIESDLTIRPVVKWSNDDLPVVIINNSTTNNTTAIREETGYTVNVVVKNNPDNEIDGRVIVALKTSEGKLLTSTESAAFHLKKNATKTIEVFMPYEQAASIADIYVVEKFSTAIPISAVLSKEIDQGTAWSNWSEEPNPEGAYQGESRTEYRYRTKSTTTSSESTLPGWEQYNVTSEWGPWGSWSGWTDTKITGSDSRQVETKQVIASQTYKTQYHYYRYKNSSGSSGNSYIDGSCNIYEDIYLDAPLTQTSWGGGYKWWHNGSNYHTMWPCSDNGTQVVTSTTYKTQYRYRDRSLVYTYHYYQWSKWSEWSTTPVTGNSTKEVETRTVYRYLADNPDLVANTDGVLRTVSGNVDSSLAGEQAILFIYKIDEASDYTNEYVGQTTIADDGSYSFSFKLREEPSIKTGDFTVTLGIEGTNAAMFLEPIIAPKPVYTVTYLDWDGTVLNTQEVTEGENAVAPETNPSREGYDFICWNNTATNVKDDLTVSPVYKIKSYTVVFIDWTKENFVMQTYEHGQPLVPPEIDSAEGNEIIGWDAIIDGTTTVTQNMVITAKYDKITYDVNFYDENGEVLNTVSVDYGESVETPVELENDNVEVLAWVPDGDIDNVTENVNVIPVFRFKNTVATPVASVETGEYTTAQTVTLSCETEDSVIFYTLNGDDPRESGTEYTGPFTISESSELKFVASAIEKNDSETVRELIAINNGSGTEKHIVTFISDRETNDYDSFFVEEGNTIGFTDDYFYRYGCDFIGAYTGLEGQEEMSCWSIENDTVTDSVNLYLYWVPQKCNVTFVGFEDEILDTQSVEYLGEAIPPEAPEVEGYVFAGYDTDDFTVTGDREITARYIRESEYVSVSLNKSKVRLPNGTSYALKTTIKNGNNNAYTLLWASSDETVAVVDDAGVITAVGAGTATVYVMIDESGSVAQCTVYVEADTDSEITIVAGNGIGIDSADQIRGITKETTVADARNMFLNEDLVFIDINGYQLEDDDFVGTGTKIRIMSGTEIVDEKIVVVTGDMNGDGKINNRDASMVIRYLVDKEVANLAQLTAIDVNGDGNVNNRDASMISRYLVGKETF